MQIPAVVDAGVTWFLAWLLPHSLYSYGFFVFVSALGGSFVVWLIALLFFMMRKKQWDTRFIILFASNAFVISVLVNCFLKNIFMRTRPFLFWRIASPACPLDFSWPSGHAAFAFGAATMLGTYDRKRRFWYFVIAALISFSRIFLLCHYFFDVISGAVIGILISLLFLRFYHRSPPPKRQKKPVHRKK